MYLALVRNQCFYKIHKRKTYFSLQKIQMTSLLCSLLLRPPSAPRPGFLKLVRSGGQSFPFSFEKIFSFSLPLCPVLSGKGNLGLAVSGSRRDTFADREWLAKDYLQARKLPSVGPQRSGCGYSQSQGSRSSWVPNSPSPPPRSSGRRI